MPAVHILVNNLGIFGSAAPLEIEDAEWRRCSGVNVLSAVRLIRAYLPVMKERGWWRVLNLASDSAVVIPAEVMHYGMKKTSLLAVSRGFAKNTAAPASPSTPSSPVPATPVESRSSSAHASAANRLETRQGAARVHGQVLPPVPHSAPPRARGDRQHGRLPPPRPSPPPPPAAPCASTAAASTPCSPEPPAMVSPPTTTTRAGAGAWSGGRAGCRPAVDPAGWPPPTRNSVSLGRRPRISAALGAGGEPRPAHACPVCLWFAASARGCPARLVPRHLTGPAPAGRMAR